MLGVKGRRKCSWETQAGSTASQLLARRRAERGREDKRGSGDVKCRDGEGSVGVARGLSGRGDVGETRGNAQVVRAGEEWR